MPEPKPKPKAKKAATRVDKHTLSYQIREVIESRGITAYALGKEAGVDATVVGRFLSGERDLRLATADRIAAALGLRLVEVAARPRGRGRPARPAGEG